MRIRGLAALLGLLLAASPMQAAPPPAAPRDCPAPPGGVAFGGALHRFAQATAGDGPIGILVVGLGGARAGGLEGPFAQTLGQALERGLAGREVRVQILPTPGMLAKDSSERVRRATTEAEPALVIWRTGLADALAMTDPAKFGLTVRRLAEWLAVKQADLVLVDLAYHAGAAQEATWRRYVAQLGAVGHGLDVPVFRRYAIMEAWAQAGSAPQATMAEACLGALLAATILDRAAQPARP
jgi:hypothetical protein